MIFSFKLKGNDWIGLFIAVYIFYLIPAFALQIIADKVTKNPADVTLAFYSIGLFVVSIGSIFILTTPLLKKLLGATKLGSRQFTYSGKTGEYMWLNISNIFLSIITLGIYLPWYITNLMRYVIGKTAYDGKNLQFNGKALHLLGIFAVTFIVPMGAYVAVVATLGKLTTQSLQFLIISQSLLLLLLIPYTYFVYKWMFNVSFGEYRIVWETDTGSSINALLVQFLLSIVTIGIYFPVACVKLYEFFSRQTVVMRGNERVYSLSAHIDSKTAFLTIWTQCILTIATLGIYGAWAYCNVVGLFINNTSLVQINSVEYRDD